LKLTTLNLNGIRSAYKKGLEPWLERLSPDCMSVQEIRAQPEDTESQFKTLAGLRGYFQHAQKKGYSGVGIYCKVEPSDLVTCVTSPAYGQFDVEGRYLEARFDTPKRKFSIITCYVPSGSSGEQRQAAKYIFLDAIYEHLEQLRTQRDFVLCSDINIAHRAIDLKNWRSNQTNSGFLPQERAWMDQLLLPGHLVDVYRQLHPTTTSDAYTWWSNRGQAWAKNVGWRLDYQIATAAIAVEARSANIYKEQRFSDHAPLTVEYGLNFA
jgi:exodeoxyribonuclease-3